MELKIRHYKLSNKINSLNFDIEKTSCRHPILYQPKSWISYLDDDTILSIKNNFR